MAKLTIDIPDRLISQATAAGYSLEAIVLEALTHYLANGLPPQPLTQTLTWQLCGRFTLAESGDSVSDGSDSGAVTNEAERVDDVLYQGF
jgi:hypothetical protein